MRFAVRHQGGDAHDVATEGPVAVIGRDPSCDLVLNDPKSSRHHAVVESGPDGLVIRDTGSANGISVNGKRTERSALKVGDVFRIGDVEVTILGEDDVGTVVMDEVDLDSMGGGPPPNTAPIPTRGSFSPPPLARPAPPPRADRRPSGRAATATARAASRPAARPLTISVLAVLWVLSIPFHVITGIALAQSRPGPGGMAIAALLALLAVIAGIMAFGLWTAQGWARPAQIGLAALGLLNCPFALASIAVLAYMLRAPARRYFAREGGDTTADQSEAVFAAAVVAAVVLGGLITAGLTIVARTARTGLG